jgi:PAS domain S-box-containing protein
VTLALLGAFYTGLTARRVDRAMRAQLLKETRMIMQAVNVRRISSLSGSAADVDLPDYQRLKEQLVLVRSANPDGRFLYLLGQRPNGTIFFFVDSEPPASKDYSPPGQTFDEVSPLCRSAFTTGQSFTEGPSSDRWGTWISGLIPLADPQTNTIIAMLGMDVNACEWRRKIAVHCFTPVATTLILILLLSGFVWVQHRTLRETRRWAAAEAKYRILFESSRDAVMTLEPPSWKFTSGNPAIVTLFRAANEADFTAHELWSLSPERQPDGSSSAAKARDMIETALRDGSHSFEWTHSRIDGETFPASVLLTRMEIDGKISLQATVRDISGQKQAEACLRQQQKLASIGTLARGMAHAINNPLNGIANYAELIKDKAADQAPLVLYANEILTESRRVALMTHSLLSFTDQADRSPAAPTAWSDILSSVLPTATAAARMRGIALSCDIPANLPTVPCRPGQIGPVLLALLTNALEALEGEKAGPDEPGKVSLTARERSPRKVRLTVEDNGPDLPEAIWERVFDPFFTTKDRTCHTGLGLWTSRTTIHNHGGELSMESVTGKGTRFHIDLPTADAEK